MGVSVRQQKRDGRWYVYFRHRGERASQKFETEEEARAVAQAVRHAITLGQFDIAALKQRREPAPEPSKAPTLAEYFETTFKPIYLESAVASSTGATYTNVFKNHITPALGPLHLDKITHNDMEEFVSNLVKKQLARATIQTIIKDLCTLMNHARKRKVVTDNPASGLSQLYSQAKAKHEVIEPLTREEVPLFLTAVRDRKESRQHYAIFMTAIHTGLRQGELAGLQTGDVDFHGKYLVVQRAIDRIHHKIVPTKTKRIRRVDLSDELAAVLKIHVQEQREYWLKHPRKNPDGTLITAPPLWLFPNEQGGWPDMRNLAERHFYRCLEKAGLHHRRPYDLRHTFASLLLTAGAPIAYVSEQMGHQNIQLTVKLYGHLQPGVNRHWMNKLPGAPKPKRAARSGMQGLKMKKAANSGRQVIDLKAGHGIRTRDFDLGKDKKSEGDQ